MGILKSDLNFINVNCILGCERCTDYFCKQEMKITEDINFCNECVYKDSREESLNLIIHSVCGREISRETELVGYVCDGSLDEIVNVNENKVVSFCPYFKKFVSKCETCVEKCKCKSKVYVCSRYKEQEKLIHLCKTCKEMGYFGCDAKGEFSFKHHIKLKENDIITECSAYKEKKVFHCEGTLNFIPLDELFKPFFIIPENPWSGIWHKGETIELEDLKACNFKFETNELRELYRLYTLKMITLDELITRVKKEVEHKREKLFELDDLHSNLVAYKQGLKELEVKDYSFVFFKKTIPAGKGKIKESNIVINFNHPDELKQKQYIAFEKYIGGVPLSDEELHHMADLKDKYREYNKSRGKGGIVILFINWCKEIYFSSYYNN